MEITNCDPSKLLYIYIHITLKKNETVLGTRKVFQRTTTCTTTFCFLGDFRGYVARMVVGCPDSIHCFTRLPLELQQNMPRWQGNDMFFFNREVSLGVVDCLIVKWCKMSWQTYMIYVILCVYIQIDGLYSMYVQKYTGIWSFTGVYIYIYINNVLCKLCVCHDICG